MRKRLLALLLVSTCLAGCGKTNEEGTTTNTTKATTDATIEATSQPTAKTDTVELKKITLDEIKKITTDEAYDWNTLATTYEMKYISEENSASYYSAGIEHNGTSYELYAQAGVVGGEGTDISLVYLQNKSTSKIIKLYTIDDAEVKCTTEQIDEFVNRRESLEQFFTIETPEGYTMGTYRAGLEGMFTGCLLYADGEEEKINPAYANRHVGLFVCTTGDEVLKYKEDGSLYIKGAAIGNDFEFIQASDTVEMQDNSQAVYGEGIIEDTKFWHIFIDREADDYCYMLYFNQSDFTKDEALSIAKTIKYAD